MTSQPKLKVVHFLNQFFAGIGAEEAANHPIEVREGAVGPGNAFRAVFKDDAEIVATIVAGDNYFNEEHETSVRTVVDTLARYRPDLVIAGPAFNAGRYGLSCAEVCHLALADGIPAVTAMFEENPGTLTYKKEVVIVPTSESVGGMPAAVAAVARIGLKLARGEELGPADEEGYIPRGIRKAGRRDVRAADRAIEMVLKKVRGEPFVTELPIELPEVVEPASPLSKHENCAHRSRYFGRASSHGQSRPTFGWACTGLVSIRHQQARIDGDWQVGVGPRRVLHRRDQRKPQLRASIERHAFTRGPRRHRVGPPRVPDYVRPGHDGSRFQADGPGDGGDS